MRERIRVLYYPDFVMHENTLKKVLLLFDELHILDRSTFSFGRSEWEQFTTISSPSPMRAFEQAFRDEGFIFAVHPPRGKTDQTDVRLLVEADVNDLNYLKAVQDGLRKSRAFREAVIPPGTYDNYGTHQEVSNLLTSIQLDTAIAGHGSPISLFNDPRTRHFDLSRPQGRAKFLIGQAAACSAKANFTLNLAAAEKLHPLSDAAPFGELLSVKYRRAIASAQTSDPTLTATDISFAIFDEAVSDLRLNTLSVKDILQYRKASASAREQFLEFVDAVQKRPLSVDAQGDREVALERFISGEVRPAARAFRNKLKSIDESLFGAVTKGVIGAAGGASLVTLFGALTWQAILPLAGASSAYLGKAAIDRLLALRAARRESSLSYVLELR